MSADDHRPVLLQNGANMSIVRVFGLMALALAAIAATLGNAEAQSLGCFEMPSRVTQYFGYGYGAGHHVPIARTPGPGPGRIPLNVTLPATCGGPYVAPYQPVGCYGEACYGGRPQLEPTPMMPMSPVGPAALPRTPGEPVAPTPAPERGAWRLFRP
jgi:hypothetical protein